MQGEAGSWREEQGAFVPGLSEGDWGRELGIAAIKKGSDCLLQKNKRLHNWLVYHSFESVNNYKILRKI